MKGNLFQLQLKKIVIYYDVLLFFLSNSHQNIYVGNMIQLHIFIRIHTV